MSSVMKTIFEPLIKFSSQNSKLRRLYSGWRRGEFRRLTFKKKIAKWVWKANLKLAKVWFKQFFWLFFKFHWSYYVKLFGKPWQVTRWTSGISNITGSNLEAKQTCFNVDPRFKLLWSWPSEFGTARNNYSLYTNIIKRHKSRLDETRHVDT